MNYCNIPGCQKEYCLSNSKVGLVFVKSKITDEGVCLAKLNDSTFQSCHNKWIVVAGNSYSVNLEKDGKCQQPSSSSEDSTNQSSNVGLSTPSYQNANSCGLKRTKQTPTHFFVQPSVLDNIVEMHLDSIFKDKTKKLSSDIFKCLHLQVLSLRNNNLLVLPAEVGKLSQLKTLILTNNLLSENTIPYTLTFCVNLTQLYLDHNLLDALPGFLLEMPHLETVYRHGNHNYFKSTFMWYHTAERDRVMPLRPNRAIVRPEGLLYQPLDLQSQAAKALVGAKVNFFTPGLLPVTLQDYVATVYRKYKICGFCGNAFLDSVTGYRVYTFKSPYAGNYCVPFEHWTCTEECGNALEAPAHREERAQARKMDQEYQTYIRSVQHQLNKKPPDKKSSCILL